MQGICGVIIEQMAAGALPLMLYTDVEVAVLLKEACGGRCVPGLGFLVTG